jgi:hypothetical protein
MIQIMIALFLAFACPGSSQSANTNTGTTVVAQDTGGDNGHVPPGDTPPPPPGS